MLKLLPWDNDSIKVRIPMRFADRKAVEENKEKFHYCPVDMGERALIMPDGQIKVCAFTIGTQECVARYSANEIVLEKKSTMIFALPQKATSCLPSRSRAEKAASYEADLHDYPALKSCG